MASYNLPLISILAYYTLCMVPHAVAFYVASRGMARHDNRNPKSSELLTNIKAKLSPRDFATFERCESCHRNGMENLPLYIAAILAGLYAEGQTGQRLNIDIFATAFLVVRTLYTVNYINTESQIWSYLRSVLFFVGAILCSTLIIRAASALA